MREGRDARSRSGPQCRCAGARMKQPRPLMATTLSPGHSMLTSSIRECHRGAGLCSLLCLRPPPPSRVSQPWSLAGRACP